MQKWEYLSLYIQYLEGEPADRGREEPGAQVSGGGWGTNETGPIGSIRDLLNHYGEEGWELVSLIPQAWDNYAVGFARETPRSAVSEYRATFKRPKP